MRSERTPRCEANKISIISHMGTAVLYSIHSMNIGCKKVDENITSMCVTERERERERERNNVWGRQHVSYTHLDVYKRQQLHPAVHHHDQRSTSELSIQETERGISMTQRQRRWYRRGSTNSRVQMTVTTKLNGCRKMQVKSDIYLIL